MPRDYFDSTSAASANTIRQVIVHSIILEQTFYLSTKIMIQSSLCVGWEMKRTQSTRFFGLHIAGLLASALISATAVIATNLRAKRPYSV